MLAGPSQWGMRRLRDVADLRVSNIDKHEKDGEVPVRLCNYVDVYKNDRITERIPFMRATAAEAEVERFRLRRGDVLITKDSETWTDIGVPALVEYEAPDLVSGYHLALLRPRPTQIQGAFLLRALQSADVAQQFHVRATGVTRFGLSHAEIKSVLVPVPPLAEQAMIVRFLDHADRRIRRAIRAKQKLIALLNEQKQAVIHRAVTRGLDPIVRLKPSNMDWLGELPEHWGVKRLHQLSDPRRPIMYGIVLPGPDVEEGVYIVKGGNCEPGGLRPERLSRTTREIEARHARSRLRPGDIVFAIRGGVGAAELIPQELEGANLTQDAARIAPAAGIESRWLLYAVRAPIFQAHVRSRIVGATVRGINIRDLKRVEVPVPPVDEQRLIVRLLDTRLAACDTSIGRFDAEIVLLRELRNRLIADVVTGGLDVRDAAAQLPDEAAEPETLDEFEVEQGDESEIEGLEPVEA